MRTYTEVVHEMAERVFDAYMGGSNEIFRNVTGKCEIVAYIFRFATNDVLGDVETEFEKISKEYYAKVNA